MIFFASTEAPFSIHVNTCFAGISKRLKCTLEFRRIEQIREDQHETVVNARVSHFWVENSYISDKEV